MISNGERSPSSSIQRWSTFVLTTLLRVLLRSKTSTPRADSTAWSYPLITHGMGPKEPSSPGLLLSVHPYPHPSFPLIYPAKCALQPPRTSLLSYLTLPFLASFTSTAVPASRVGAPCPRLRTLPATTPSSSSPSSYSMSYSTLPVGRSSYTRRICARFKAFCQKTAHMRARFFHQGEGNLHRNDAQVMLHLHS